MKKIPLVLTIVCFLNSSCATLPSPEVMAEQVKNFKLPAQPQAGSALVYFIQPPPSANPGLSIYLDGQRDSHKVGYTKNSLFIYFSVLPGQHDLFVHSFFQGKNIWLKNPFSAKEGDTLFFKKQPKIFNAYDISIVPVESELEGKYLVKQRLLSAYWLRIHSQHLTTKWLYHRYLVDR